MSQPTSPLPSPEPQDNGVAGRVAFPEDLLDTAWSHRINVVVCGETNGVRSAVINLIAGKEVATASSDVSGRAMQSTRYDISFGDTDVTLFDVIGLREPRVGVNGYLRIVEKAHELIVKLGAAGGVHLLLFCFPAERMSDMALSSYRLFSECLCDKEVPKVLAFIGFACEEEGKDWSKQNKDYIEYHRLKSGVHTCLTTVRGNTSAENSLYTESQREIREVLKTSALEKGFLPERHSWLAKFGRDARVLIEKHRKPQWWRVRVLMRRCKLEPEKISGVVLSIMEERKTDQAEPAGQATKADMPFLWHLPSPAQPRTINVVLFGTTDGGKNSIVNLIAGKEVAKVSSDMDGCTMQATRYNISLDGMQFAVFDVAGLDECRIEVSGYLKAIEKAWELIEMLSTAGGIHRLLFCMRRGRITPTTRCNYRLFVECLCSTKVPIALVFTDFEKEVEMEDWWTRNKGDIKDSGIEGDAYACIPAVQDDALEQDLKYTESQRKVRVVLKTHGLRNEAFSPEQHSWFSRLAEGMKDFIEGYRNPRRRDIIRVLTRRCKLDLATAKKIVTTMKRSHKVEDGSRKVEIALLRDRVQRLDEELAELQHTTDGLLCVRAQQIRCEASYAQDRNIEAAESLLEIVNTMSEVVKDDQPTTDWIAEFTHRCISKLESIGDEALNVEKHDTALLAYSTLLSLGLPNPHTVLTRWTRTMLIDHSADEVLEGSSRFKLSKFAVYQAVCNILEGKDRIADAIAYFRQMQSELVGSMNICCERGQWERDFQLRCIKRLGDLGSVSMVSKDYEKVVEHFTSLLSLDSGAGHHADVIDAFRMMLSKLEESPGKHIRGFPPTL